MIASTGVLCRPEALRQDGGVSWLADCVQEAEGESAALLLLNSGHCQPHHSSQSHAQSTSSLITVSRTINLTTHLSLTRHQPHHSSQSRTINLITHHSLTHHQLHHSSQSHSPSTSSLTTVSRTINLITSCYSILMVARSNGYPLWKPRLNIRCTR